MLDPFCICFACSNFTIPSDLLVLSLPVISGTSIDNWKKEQVDHYRRHHLVVKHIQANKDVDKDILEKALCFDEYSEITEEHLALCLDIYNTRVSMPLPVPNTEHVSPFTELVGSEHP